MAVVRDGVSGMEFLKDAKKGSLSRLLSENSQNSLLLLETNEDPRHGAKLSYLTHVMTASLACPLLHPGMEGPFPLQLSGAWLSSRKQPATLPTDRHFKSSLSNL